MRRPGTPAVLALVAAALAVLAALGVWQLARHGYKQRLAEERAAALAAAPLAAGEAARAASDGGGGADAVAWRRVALDGEWDYARAQIVANRTRFGLRGEEVYVPLRPADGAPALLVRRGWYPAEERGAVLAGLAASEPAEGLALPSGGAVAGRGADGAWIRFGPASIAAALPYAVAPVHVAAGGLADPPPRRLPDERPVTGYARWRNTTPHVEYALTWFGLAAALAATAGARMRRGRAGRGAAPGPPARDPRVR